MEKNTIHCAEASALLSLMPDQSVDLVVTDPPYLCGYRDSKGRTVKNDTKDNADAVLSVFDEVYRVMKQDSYCISFYGWNSVAEFTARWKNLGFRVVGHFVWEKPYASKSGFAHYHHESAFLLAKGRPLQPYYKIKDVLPWQYTGNHSHPTEKPISAITPLIHSFSKPGDMVLDPFLGSGTTAVAAALAGRDYIGIELDGTHCRTARKRLTGVRRYAEAQEAV